MRLGLWQSTAPSPKTTMIPIPRRRPGLGFVSNLEAWKIPESGGILFRHNGRVYRDECLPRELHRYSATLFRLRGRSTLYSRTDIMQQVMAQNDGSVDDDDSQAVRALIIPAMGWCSCIFRAWQFHSPAADLRRRSRVAT